MNNDDKMIERPSFSKNKIGQYATGTSGITGTRESSVNPISEVTANLDGKYNSSEMLFQNIDKLASIIYGKQTDEETEEIEYDNDTENIDNYTEEELAQNLDFHFNNRRISLSAIPQNVVEQPMTTNSNVLDKFCRNCGQRFLNNDNFCGNCGLKRNKANLH